MKPFPISAIICCYDREMYATAAEPWVKKYFDDVVEVASRHSIFEAYNRGHELAKHDIRLFVHEDVRIIDESELVRWVSYFLDHDEIDLAGVIGSKALEKLPWWMNKGVGYIRQGGERAYHEFGYSYSGKAEDAASIDGLFMLSRFSYIWPEDRYSGWHAYDALISNAAKNIKVFPIRVHHMTKQKPRTIHENLIECYDTLEAETGIPFVREQWFKTDESLKPRLVGGGAS